MRCLVIYDTEDEVVINYWWCSSMMEYIEKRKLFRDCYPSPRYELTTEYERSSYNLDNALGY